MRSGRHHCTGRRGSSGFLLGLLAFIGAFLTASAVADTPTLYQSKPGASWPLAGLGARARCLLIRTTNAPGQVTTNYILAARSDYFGGYLKVADDCLNYNKRFTAKAIEDFVKKAETEHQAQVRQEEEERRAAYVRQMEANERTRAAIAASQAARASQVVVMPGGANYVPLGQAKRVNIPATAPAPAVRGPATRAPAQPFT